MDNLYTGQFFAQGTLSQSPNLLSKRSCLAYSATRQRHFEKSYEKKKKHKAKKNKKTTDLHSVVEVVLIQLVDIMTS